MNIQFTWACSLPTYSSELLLTGNLLDLFGSMLEHPTEFPFPVAFTTAFAKHFQQQRPIKAMRKMIDNNFSL